MKKLYRERRLYFFICHSCGTENRQSFKRVRANRAQCRTCRRTKISESQLKLI